MGLLFDLLVKHHTNWNIYNQDRQTIFKMKD